MFENDSPINQFAWTFYGGFGPPFPETPNPTTNRQGRTHLLPTHPPPSQFFIRSRDATKRSEQLEKASMTQEQDVNLMAKYKAYTNNMASYMEMMIGQNH